MLNNTQFSVLYPTLAMFSQGTYTRVRRGKTEIVRKKKKKKIGGFQAAGLGFVLGGIPSIVDDQIDFKNDNEYRKLLLKHKQYDRYRDLNKSKKPLYLGLAKNKAQKAALAFALPAAGAAAGYGAYKLYKHATRKKTD